MPILVGISGGSCSGKSTVCENLKGKNVEHVPTDYFFKSDKEIKKENIESFDHPDAFKMNLMYDALKSIKSGENVRIPVYSRKLKRTVGKKTIKAKNIILIEGIMVFHDKRIRDLLDIKIFFDAPVELQRQRRIKRCEKLGWTFNAEYFDNFVVSGYKKYILPTKKYADFIIDASKSIEVMSDEMKKILKLS